MVVVIQMDIYQKLIYQMSFRFFLQVMAFAALTKNRQIYWWGNLDNITENTPVYEAIKCCYDG